MSSLALKNEVANDKRKPFEFLITIEEAKEFGIPAKILLKMILANMSRRYKFLYPSIQNLANWTGLKPRTVENELYRLVSDGWLVKAVDEIGRRGYKRPDQEGETEIHQTSAKLHQISAELHQSSASLHQVSADLHQSDESKYTNLVQKIHQPDETHYIPKDKVNLTKELKEEEEGLTPLSPSAPRPSASSVSSPDSQTSFEFEELRAKLEQAEAEKRDLLAAVKVLTAAKPVNGSGSLVTTTAHSETRTDTVQGQEGGKMEPTEEALPVVSKPKAVRAVRPPILGIEDEIPEKEKQIALSQLAEWLPALQIKQDFRTEKLGKALQAFVIRRREKYLKRIKGFEEPLTRLGLQCQLTKAQKWGYDKCLESIWTAAGEGWKGFFEPRPMNQNGTLKSFKQQDEERAEESLKAWVEKKNAEVNV